MSAAARALSSVCPVQAASLAEKVMLVDRQDNIVGAATKKDAHLMENITRSGMLHRAFSVFLFNSRRELLVQQRSPDKITFPLLYTNTCCSHPLSSLPNERDPVTGIKEAAVRRLKHELGITEVTPEDITLLTRIIYFGSSCETWGEHELDHVLLVQKDVVVEGNPDEVACVRYMSKEELMREMGDEERFPVTPWFKIISESMLPEWWDRLEGISGDGKIHEFSFP